MIETPRLVTISTPRARPTPTLGGPFELILSTVPLHNPTPDQNTRTVTSRNFAYLVPHRSGVGNEWWLVTVGRMEDRVMTGEEAERAVGVVEGDHNGELVPLGAGRTMLWWRGTDRCRMVRCGWGEESMKLLWDREGDPATQGLWLAQRLLPRTAEGAVRDTENKEFQVWMKL